MCGVRLTAGLRRPHKNVSLAWARISSHLCKQSHIVANHHVHYFTTVRRKSSQGHQGEKQGVFLVMAEWDSPGCTWSVAGQHSMQMELTAALPGLSFAWHQVSCNPLADFCRTSRHKLKLPSAKLLRCCLSCRIWTPILHQPLFATDTCSASSWRAQDTREQGPCHVTPGRKVARVTQLVRRLLQDTPAAGGVGAEAPFLQQRLDCAKELVRTSFPAQSAPTSATRQRPVWIVSDPARPGSRASSGQSIILSTVAEAYSL
jgi:hypothetical protein